MKQTLFLLIFGIIGIFNAMAQSDTIGRPNLKGFFYFDYDSIKHRKNSHKPFFIINYEALAIFFQTSPLFQKVQHLI